MAEDEAIVRAAKEQIEKILGAPIRRVFASVVETKFPWLRTGRVVWARTPGWKQALLWVVPEREPMQLNGPDGLSYLSEMLVDSTGPLPGGLPPLRLAETIRQLTYDPRGVVASPDYLGRLGSGITDWLKHDTPVDRRLFEEQFTEPVLQCHDGGSWSLEFHCFNVAGGVEQWHADGDAGRILRAARSPRVADGTFRWPMA
jgi:hypothetical protein